MLIKAKLPHNFFKAETDADEDEETILDELEWQRPNKNQLQLFPASKITKAYIHMRDGLLILSKAKAYQTGEISEKTGKKKVAPGKWETVGDSKGKGKPEKEPTDKKPKKDDKGKGGLARVKEAMKAAMKSMVETLSDYYSGQSGLQEAAHGVKETGEKLKKKPERVPTKPEEPTK